MGHVEERVKAGQNILPRHLQQVKQRSNIAIRTLRNLAEYLSVSEPTATTATAGGGSSSSTSATAEAVRIVEQLALRVEELLKELNTAAAREVGGQQVLNLLRVLLKHLQSVVEKLENWSGVGK